MDDESTRLFYAQGMIMDKPHEGTLLYPPFPFSVSSNLSKVKRSIASRDMPFAILSACTATLLNEALTSFKSSRRLPL